MGKRGNVGLMLPKNNASKEDIDALIKIIKNNDGIIHSNKLIKKLEQYYSSKGKVFDRTTLLKRTETPRYFGLVYYNNSTRNFHLTDFGYEYITSSNSNQLIDCMFLILSSVTFGINNNGNGTSSNVEAPNVLLKLALDLNEVSIIQFAITLFFMDVKKLTYPQALAKIKNDNKIPQLKNYVVSNGGQKLFDPKFNLFFESLGIIIKNQNGKYELSKYVKQHYESYIKDLSPFNNDILIRKDSNEEKKETTKYNKTVDEILEVIKSLDTSKIKPTYSKPYSVKNIGKLKVSRVSKRIGYKTMNRVFNNTQKSLIGWLGEEYVYNLLNNNDSNMKKNLYLSNDEEINNIEWFNKGCTMDDNWEDQSVGRGCDIVVYTSQRTIKIEVKSSFQSTPFFSATTNELLTMDSEKKNYYIIKVDNIKKLSTGESPNIKIINNPIKIINDLHKIKDITLYL